MSRFPFNLLPSAVLTVDQAAPLFLGGDIGVLGHLGWSNPLPWGADGLADRP